MELTWPGPVAWPARLVAARSGGQPGFKSTAPGPAQGRVTSKAIGTSSRR